jgi:hypothetical protein
VSSRLFSARTFVAGLTAALIAYATHAQAQVLRPPGFLDISGTYLKRSFEGHCKPILPPNDILRLTRDGDIEETETGAILRYKGVLENFRTYWVRDDCSSIDLDEPSCVGLLDPPGTHCELVGQSLAVSGTVTYAVSESVFGRFIDGAIDLDITRDATLDPPFSGGGDPYLDVGSIDISVQLGGKDLPLGQVDELTGNLGTYSGFQNGPLWRCTCNASGPAVGCCTGEQTFEKVEGPTAALEIEGPLEGVLRSSQPTLTETPNEVHFANLQLLFQEDGRVRAKLGNETDQHYDQYLASRRLREVKSLTIEKKNDGTYTFDTPGAFVFSDIPVFQPFNRGGKTVLELAYYALRIIEAHTDEQALDDSSQPIPGKVAPVPFATKTAYNFAARTEPREVLLDPIDEIAAKQSIIDRLRARCPVGYGPIEEEAEDYLDQLRGGAIELTEEIEEGLSRGLWAERTVNAGVPLADELIGIQLRGLAKLISDAIGELVRFEGQALTDAKRTESRMENALSVPAGFKSSGLTAAEKTALADATVVIQAAAVTGAMRKTVKALKVPMSWALIQGGVDPARARKIVDLYVLVVDSILNEAEKGRIEAGLIPILRFLVERLVPELKPLLLDGSSITYCAGTAPSLETAVDGMKSWSEANQNAYLLDRQQIIQTITDMNSEASLVIAGTNALLEIASGLSAVQDAFDVIANVVKWAEVIKRIALVSKFGANAIAAVAPPIEAFVRIPIFVDRGVFRAFGETAPLLVASANAADGGAPSVYRASLTVGVPADTAYKTTLDAIGDALKVDDFGLVVGRLTSEAPGSYRAERRAWVAQAEALTLAAAGADAAGINDAAAAEAVSIAHADATELLAIEQEMLDALRTLAVDVLSAEYDDPADALYVARRKRVNALIDSTLVKIGQVTLSLQSLKSKLDASGASFVPAVSVESLTATSDTTAETFISASPETFTVTARLRNVGDQAVGAFTAVLSNPSENTGLTISAPAEQAVAGLAAADATNGSGPDETELEWTVTYAGAFTLDPIFLDVKLLEGGEEPATFVTSGRQTTLLIDPDLADADLDGLPDGWETAKGLDPETDDAEADPDSDNLINRAELQLGTHPTPADTDADGIEDGAEVSGANGFATDPLDDDTDDDGVLDGADPSPLDGDSQQAPPPADEPQVAVSSQAVTLNADSQAATIDVSNAGTGTLVWTAESDEPALVSVTPQLPQTQDGPATLYITTGPGFDANAEGALQTKVRVADVGGAIRDEKEITVTLGEGENLCGHPVSGSASSPITASEALFTLRAAVGIGSCATCLCDADGSGAVTATDALIILRAAVGQPVTLACPLC